jgi:hypothetical protein
MLCPNTEHMVGVGVDDSSELGSGLVRRGGVVEGRLT